MGFLDRFFGRPPDQKSFGALVVETMRNGGETRPIDFDERRFQVIVGDPGGQLWSHWLGNAYEEYCALPTKERSRVLARFHPSARPDFDSFDKKEGVLRSLLPRVRDRLYPNLLGARLRRQLGRDTKDVPSLPHRPLGEVLAASLCIDLPATVLDCTADKFEGWKATFEELWPVALDNLRAISKTPFRQVAPGVFSSPFSDSHDPARLLLPELFKALPLKGAPVASVPNRNTLIVTGADDVAGLNELVSLTKMGLKDPRPVSSMPLVLRDAWVPFTPPAGHPIGKELLVLAAQCRAGLYAEQKATLLEEFEAAGRDVFIATYSAMMKGDTGEVLTMASWTEGVETLLPKTDEVSLVVLHGDNPGDAEVTRVEWSKVQAVAGARMKPEPGLWPERWLVESFPSPDELAKLKAIARRPPTS